MKLCVSVRVNGTLSVLVTSIVAVCKLMNVDPGCVSVLTTLMVRVTCPSPSMSLTPVAPAVFWITLVSPPT